MDADVSFHQREHQMTAPRMRTDHEKTNRPWAQARLPPFYFPWSLTHVPEHGTSRCEICVLSARISTLTVLLLSLMVRPSRFLSPPLVLPPEQQQQGV